MLKTAYDIGAERAYDDFLFELDGFDKEAGKASDALKFMRRVINEGAERIPKVGPTLAKPRHPIDATVEGARKGVKHVREAINAKAKDVHPLLADDAAVAAGKAKAAAKARAAELAAKAKKKVQEGGEVIKEKVQDAGRAAADGVMKTDAFQTAARGVGVAGGAVGGYATGNDAADSPVGGVLGALAGGAAGYGGLRGLRRLAQHSDKVKAFHQAGGAIPAAALLGTSGLVAGGTAGGMYGGLVSDPEERRRSTRWA